MGRQKFLAAAGVISTSALAAGKLSDLADPFFRHRGTYVYNRSNGFSKCECGILRCLTDLIHCK